MVNAFNPTPKNKMSFDLSPDAIARMTAPQPQKVVFTARGVDPEMRKRAQEIKRKSLRSAFASKEVSDTYRDQLAEQIWKETGLWEYQPNVWVKEIPDNETTLNAPFPSPEMLPRLGNGRTKYSRPVFTTNSGEQYMSGDTVATGMLPDIMKRGANDELYKLYPELNKVPMEVYNDYITSPSAYIGGYVNPKTGGLAVGIGREDLKTNQPQTNEQVEDKRSALAVHELQHILNTLDMMRSFKMPSPYESRGTEVLARLAEKRKNLTAKERREISPMYSPDVFNIEGYREDVKPSQQYPKRKDKADVESSPVDVNVYGIKPKRSVKPLDPALQRGSEVKNTLLRLVRKEDKKEPSPRKRK